MGHEPERLGTTHVDNANNLDATKYITQIKSKFSSEW